MITVIEQPRSTRLVTLARMKRSLGFTDDNDERDTRLLDLIDDVSSAIVAYCGRTFARDYVVENMVSAGRTVLSLDRTPTLRVDQVSFGPVTDENLPLNPSGYSIIDREAGFLGRDGELWDPTLPVRTWITPQVVNMPGQPDWYIEYTGGYLMPEDSFAASGVVVAHGSDNSFEMTGSDKWPLLVSGEQIRFTGFATSGNNGTHTVVSRTEDRLYVTSTLTHEIASGVVNISVDILGNTTLPRDLQRLAMQEISAGYFSEQRDGDIKSEKIGDWSASYGGTSLGVMNELSGSGLTARVAQGLRRYMRIM